MLYDVVTTYLSLLETPQSWPCAHPELRILVQVICMQDPCLLHPHRTPLLPHVNSSHPKVIGNRIVDQLAFLTAVSPIFGPRAVLPSELWSHCDPLRTPSAPCCPWARNTAQEGTSAVWAGLKEPRPRARPGPSPFLVLPRAKHGFSSFFKVRETKKNVPLKWPPHLALHREVCWLLT